MHLAKKNRGRELILDPCRKARSAHFNPAIGSRDCAHSTVSVIPSEMSSVADQLRTAREAQGMSLRDLAEVTKIRADYIEAIEHANYDPFPAPVYIRGSVRTCASILKLDVPSVIAALEAELAESPEFSEPPSLTGQQRGPLDWLMYQLSRVNWRVAGVLGLGLVVFGGGLIAWQAWNRRVREDPLSRLTPGLYKPATNITEGDVLPVPSLERSFVR